MALGECKYILGICDMNENEITWKCMKNIDFVFFFHLASFFFLQSLADGDEQNVGCRHCRAGGWIVGYTFRAVQDPLSV